MTVTEIVLAVVLLLYCSAAVRSIVFDRRILRLSPRDESAPDARVSVVIPARNEEKAIERTVRSLLAQEEAVVEVIVVNDGSTDRTGEILARIDDARLRVITDPPLQSGWLGKANAMHAGAREAKHDLILFCDADIHFTPRALTVAVAAKRKRDVDLLSLFPRFHWRTPFENGVLPVFFLGIGAVDARKVPDPSSSVAAAIGAFLLLSRRAYEAIGGHESVKDSVVDDLMLAKAMKSRGFRIDVGIAPELLSVRMYDGNYRALRGFEKNVLGPLGKFWWAAPLVVLVYAVVFWASPVVALVDQQPVTIGLALALYAVQLASLFTVRSWHRFSPAVIFFPLCVVTMAWSVAFAMWCRIVRGSVVWRGREVSVKPPS